MAETIKDMNPAIQVMTCTVWGLGFALGGFLIAAMIPHEGGMEEAFEAIFITTLGHTIGSIVGVNWYGNRKQMKASKTAPIAGGVLGLAAGILISDGIENPIPVIFFPSAFATLGYILTDQPRQPSVSLRNFSNRYAVWRTGHEGGCEGPQLKFRINLFTLRF